MNEKSPTLQCTTLHHLERVRAPYWLKTAYDPGWLVRYSLRIQSLARYTTLLVDVRDVTQPEVDTLAKTLVFRTR